MSSKNPDINFRVVATDEASAVFNRVGNSLKKMGADANATFGGRLKQQAVAMGIGGETSVLAMLKGGGALAGVTILGNVMADLSGKAVKWKEAMAEGAMSSGDVAEELMKSIPVLGQFYKVGRDLHELATGEEASAARLLATYKLLEKSLEYRGKLLEKTTDLEARTANTLQTSQEMLAAGRVVPPLNELAMRRAATAAFDRQRKQKLDEDLRKERDSALPLLAELRKEEKLWAERSLGGQHMLDPGEMKRRESVQKEIEAVKQGVRNAMKALRDASDAELKVRQADDEEARKNMMRLLGFRENAGPSEIARTLSGTASKIVEGLREAWQEGIEQQKPAVVRQEAARQESQFGLRSAGLSVLQAFPAGVVDQDLLKRMQVMQESTSAIAPFTALLREPGTTPGQAAQIREIIQLMEKNTNIKLEQVGGGTRLYQANAPTSEARFLSGIGAAGNAAEQRSIELNSLTKEQRDIMARLLTVIQKLFDMGGIF